MLKAISIEFRKAYLSYRVISDNASYFIYLKAKCDVNQIEGRTKKEQATKDNLRRINLIRFLYNFM